MITRNAEMCRFIQFRWQPQTTTLSFDERSSSYCLPRITQRPEFTHSSTGLSLSFAFSTSTFWIQRRDGTTYDACAAAYPVWTRCKFVFIDSRCKLHLIQRQSIRWDIETAAISTEGTCMPKMKEGMDQLFYFRGWFILVFGTEKVEWQI